MFKNALGNPIEIDVFFEIVLSPRLFGIWFYITLYNLHGKVLYNFHGKI